MEYKLFNVNMRKLKKKLVDSVRKILEQLAKINEF